MEVLEVEENTEENVETPLQDRQKVEYYRSIFDKYDEDHDGFINIQELDTMLKSHKNQKEIPPYAARKIHKMADKDNDELVDFNEFIDMINHPDLRYYFGHYVNIYRKKIVPQRRGKTPDSDADLEYSCKPPAVGMLIMSVIQIIFFCIDEASKDDSTKSPTGSIAEVLIYDPQKRSQVWRFITYMFVHIGILHLVVNLLVQMLLGSLLEMEHRWWRVLIIYFSGVFAGSLATSITDRGVRLAGASGGVYALITAHISAVVLNWSKLKFPHIQLIFFLIITGVDLGTAIHDRYFEEATENIGYVAHLAGAVAGLLVGLHVLRNLEVTKIEIYIWWISIILYCLFIGIAVVWNLAWPSYFSKAAGR